MKVQKFILAIAKPEDVSKEKWKTDCERTFISKLHVYHYAEPNQVPRLYQWENELTDDVFGIEEEVKHTSSYLGSPPSAIGIPWSSMEFHGNPQSSKEFHGILWNSIEFPWHVYGTAWSICRVPWSSIESHGMSMDVHGILLNFMECPSGVSIEFHGVLENLKCTTFHGGTMKSSELSYVSNYTHCRIKCNGIKCLRGG